MTRPQKGNTRKMTKTSPFIRNLSMDFEAAHEAVDEMENVTVEELQGVTVYSGKHPKHGNIHIVIPALGDSLLLLPFAFHDF